MSWLLVFLPLAIALEHLAPERPLLVFPAAGLAIVPLAGWTGRATEQIAVDGRSDRLKGVRHLGVYLLLALVFFFIPTGG